MQEKIKSDSVLLGMNSTLRAAKKEELDMIVYASNLSEDMSNELSKLKVPTYKYDGDSEALAIACGKSFNVSVLGIKK